MTSHGSAKMGQQRDGSAKTLALLHNANVCDISNTRIQSDWCTAVLQKQIYQRQTSMRYDAEGAHIV